MSASTAIGMVSRSLQILLTSEMTMESVNVTVLAPDDPGGAEPRINLFLYKVQEHAALKNMDWQVNRQDPSRLAPPPLSLKLFYLLTPYVPKDSGTADCDAHELLGEAMRVFYEHPVVPQDYLDPGLVDARESIKIALNGLELEELGKVWSTFTQPYRLSVLYEVSVVQLDMLPESERVMAHRVRRIGVPQVRAPFYPPCVEEIDPVSGPAGSVVTFAGRHLAGWKAYVAMTGRRIADGLECGSDTFQVTIPQDLPPGFHEMRTDVSRLFRRTFFFEVTA